MDTILEFSARERVKQALFEDLPSGDITTEAVLWEKKKGEAVAVAKEAFVLAGTLCFRLAFEILDPEVTVHFNTFDGEEVERGQVIAKVVGDFASILKGERVALNFLQRLSGIATLTRRFVREVEGCHVRICDTRKTTPGLRALEKYAVRIGGGHNHRSSLSDGILIKDNHIAACCGVGEAVRRARRMAPHTALIEVEVSSKEGLLEAISAGARAVLFDNMDIEELKEAVRIAREKAPGLLLEASGGVRLENVRSIAETGVDIISIGALTHSARSMDISLRICQS